MSVNENDYWIKQAKEQLGEQKSEDYIDPYSVNKAEEDLKDYIKKAENGGELNPIKLYDLSLTLIEKQRKLIGWLYKCIMNLQSSLAEDTKAKIGNATNQFKKQK